MSEIQLDFIERLHFLQEKIKKEPHADYSFSSRVHALTSFFQAQDTKCYVKRDDELGFSISGSKLRKYRMLLPYLRSQGYLEVVVIGSSFSNHVLGIVQLLIA